MWYACDKARLLEQPHLRPGPKFWITTWVLPLWKDVVRKLRNLIENNENQEGRNKSDNKNDDKKLNKPEGKKFTSAPL